MPEPRRRDPVVDTARYVRDAAVGTPLVLGGLAAGIGGALASGGPKDRPAAFPGQMLPGLDWSPVAEGFQHGYSQFPGAVMAQRAMDESFGKMYEHLGPLSYGVDFMVPGPDLAAIKAFHGSPHRFSRFSMKKIGTGEGAQAFGHGLYFAERPGVAKDYQRRLTRGANVVKVNGRAQPDVSIDTNYFPHESDPTQSYGGLLKPEDWTELADRWEERIRTADPNDPALQDLADEARDSALAIEAKTLASGGVPIYEPDMIRAQTMAHVLGRGDVGQLTDRRDAFRQLGQELEEFMREKGVDMDAIHASSGMRRLDALGYHTYPDIIDPQVRFKKLREEIEDAMSIHATEAEAAGNLQRPDLPILDDGNVDLDAIDYWDFAEEGDADFWESLTKQHEAFANLERRVARGEDIELDAGGAIYETMLDVEPEQLLDYDAPLHEQPGIGAAIEASDNPLLKAAYKRSLEAAKHGEPMRGTGKGLYDELAKRIHQNMRNPSESRANAEASRLLHEAGIPGLRFKDQLSRGVQDTPRWVNKPNPIQKLKERIAVAKEQHSAAMPETFDPRWQTIEYRLGNLKGMVDKIEREIADPNEQMFALQRYFAGADIPTTIEELRGLGIEIADLAEQPRVTRNIVMFTDEPIEITHINRKPVGGLSVKGGLK